MSASLKAAQIIRCINAGVSCLASTSIMFMILTEPKTGLASPYSRIIFAMSISDILFSLGILLSPFMSPKHNPDAFFAIGTTGSCEAIGFTFTLGFFCMCFYTVFLTYYFMRRIKYKVTPQTFAKKEEKYFHMAFCFIAFFMATVSLLIGSISPQAYGSLCISQSYPEGCDQSPDIICERGGDKVTKILNLCGAFFAGSSLISLISILTVHHVYKEERTFTIPAREIGNFNPHQHRQRQENINVADQNKMMLTKQALHQSILYLLAFYMIYLPLLILNIQKKFLNESKEPEWRFWLTSLITPLGGVFNILIYTRPKVLKMKETFPDTPYYELLTVIVVSGGEIPSIADLLNTTTTKRKHGEEVQQEEGELDDDREYLSEQALSMSDVSSKDLISYDLDVSSAAELNFA